ncbi:NAD(P)H dehydrogenase subunit NdhS [Candidatus Cyanaurora vandensis]|uniref:NAD(P)H dehydrogenase subunit NdhS n=1 Tax=Candidatus Cyanaurora vandensis TaxID=2714958 RepID=UPI0025796744|nr:NAD(P)H dehydrogenase subunit NdhS [Candidatus Cyanaurora vandensis]
MSPIRPGMPVKVINPDDIYYGFEGQVQKLIDGMVAVIFTGGNWIKLVSFKPKDLEVLEKTKGKRS